jgi:hypothetical protein
VAKQQRAQRDEHALEQPTEAPKVDGGLVGEHVELLVQIEVPEVDEKTGQEEMKYSKQWLPAVVSTISDGIDTKAGSKRQKLKVKAGWFLLDYQVRRRRVAVDTAAREHAQQQRGGLVAPRPGLRPRSCGDAGVLERRRKR